MCIRQLVKEDCIAEWIGSVLCRSGRASPDNGFFYMLASASSNYTKPELVTNTFFDWLGEELPEFAFTVKRLEMYADEGENASPRFVTLESLGEEIE